MDLYSRLRRTLREREEAGLRKFERVISSSQGTEIVIAGRETPVLNFCANNYLGLADHPVVINAAHRALETYGYGLSSVRFICGTQRIHKQLEERLSEFLGMEDALLYTSCFDANGGLFENMLGEKDAIVSARLNHASIIDGVRLSRARRFVYNEGDAEDFDRKLAEAAVGGADAVGGSAGEGVTLAITDGVFSMEGHLAPLDKLVPVARKRDALLVVDDSHATGLIGEGGRGTPERFGVEVDAITSTLGKALGGACGGFTAGRKDLIEWLRNTSRPYLFSNSLAPSLVAGAMAALQVVRSDEGAQLRARLRENTTRFRQSMRDVGFDIPEGEHPIVPVMLGDAALALRMADRLLDLGVYVIGFSHPVVPEGEARIRVQISALHTPDQIDQAVEAFATVARELGLMEPAPGLPPRETPVSRAQRAPAGPRTMRAWVYHNEKQPDGGHLSLEEVPVPRPKPGELLVRVLRVTVCGTDEDLFRGKFTQIHEGVIPGHEIFGEIAGLGSNVRGFDAGQKIVAESHYLLPGYLEEGVIGLWGPKVRASEHLRPVNGGYAEYAVIPTYCAHIVPEALNREDFFASLLEGAGNDCLVAKYLLDHGHLGTVGVVGCGPHGLFTQLFAKHFGVRRLLALEIDADRLARAREFGADFLLNPGSPDADRRLGEITDGKGLDAVVDIAGGHRDVLDMCFRYVRNGGAVVLFGLYGDDSVALDGVPVDEIIFGMRDLDVERDGKKVHVRGITGREGIWEYLIDAVAASPALQRKLMAPVTVMGPLDNLGRDTLRFDPAKIMKRAYTAFAPR
ncbi:MAG TPA: glycine C-acetyltransferase [Sumerlaeia bacterium]|nr:glycine C-acetyltransferase [Sumerlaeia bacterium]